ncbi:MAG: DUF1553 domain-containing protein [Gemmataceae bacterium]
MRTSARLIGTVALSLLSTWCIQAEPPDFDRQVAPILVACVDCHSGNEAKGGFDLSRKTPAFAGGDSGLAGIVPGKLSESSVWEKIHGNEMPPKKPLSDSQKAVIKSWIESGAKWGREPIDPLAYTTGLRAGRDWWALQPVKRIDASKANNPPSGSVHPVDRFILAKLSDNQLTLSPEADRRTLLRRLKLDLLGLPPTPEEVTAFVNDRSPDAYEKRVDQYLASSHYGERSARHWLDVVRFAESNGFETNTIRANAWHYRDWVIRSFNEDLPYDRFVFEQIAGDTCGSDAATGFLVAGAWDEVKSPDRVLTLNQRADELHDMVNTVGTAFLGLTVGCARCHSHKFDPVSQLDYYRLKALLSGVQHGEREVKTKDFAARNARTNQLRKELAEIEASLAKAEPLADPTAWNARRPAVSARLNIERFQPTTARFVRLIVFATNSEEPCIDEFEVFSTGPQPKNVALASNGAKASTSGSYQSSPDIHRLEFVNDGRYGNNRSWISNSIGGGRLSIEFAQAYEIDRIVWARDRDGRFQDRLATRYRIDASLDGKNWQVVATSDDRAAMGTKAGPPPALSAKERQEWNRQTARAIELRKQIADLQRTDQAYAGRFEKPEPVHRLNRGDPVDEREIVPPGVLSEIRPRVDVPDSASELERRVALARWLTDPANPLTARVMVNRIWQQHFGVGLVATPSDFGFNGGRPSHPELLDWLAGEFIAQKWSMKTLHRLIVTSRAYRQSSRASVDGLAKDAGARLLWRYPPRRLEAEAIRDSMLVVSGSINWQAGGPGFDLFEPNTNYVKVYTPKKVFGPAEFRRMIYQQKPRMQLDDTFGAFDCPDGGQISPKRNISSTPLQSLNLLNSSFAIQMAAAFAKRVEAESGSEGPERIRTAFRLAFQRNPSETELAGAVKLVKEFGLTSLCRALLNANEFLYVD